MSSEAHADRFGLAPGGRCRNNSRGITRRGFVRGVLAGGVVAGLDLWRWPAFAAKNAAGPPILSGNSFNLVVEQVPVNYTGHPAYATAAEKRIAAVKPLEAPTLAP